MNPRDSSPPSPTAPGGRARRPKRKRVPADALSRTFTTAPLTKTKTFDPAGTTKMKRAIRICRTVPQRTTRQFTTRRSAERSHATPIRTKIPAKLTRLYIAPLPARGSGSERERRRVMPGPDASSLAGMHSANGDGQEPFRAFAVRATSLGLTQRIAPYRFPAATTACIAVMLTLAWESFPPTSHPAPGRSGPSMRKTTFPLPTETPAFRSAFLNAATFSGTKSSCALPPPLGKPLKARRLTRACARATNTFADAPALLGTTTLKYWAFRILSAMTDPPAGTAFSPTCRTSPLDIPSAAVPQCGTERRAHSSIGEVRCFSRGLLYHWAQSGTGIREKFPRLVKPGKKKKEVTVARTPLGILMAGIRFELTTFGLVAGKYYFVISERKSPTVWMTIPIVTFGLFIYGPKWRRSPARKCVALHRCAAANTGRSFSGSENAHPSPATSGTRRTARRISDNRSRAAGCFRSRFNRASATQYLLLTTSPLPPAASSMTREAFPSGL